MDEFGRRRFLARAAGAAGAFWVKPVTGTPAAATGAAGDAASAAGYVDVQLLHITDLHGYLSAAPARDSAYVLGRRARRTSRPSAPWRRSPRAGSP